MLLKCLVPNVKHGEGSVMIWAAMSWYYASPIIDPNSLITAGDYVDMLGNKAHPIVKMFFLKMMQIFNMTIRPETQPETSSLGLRKMKMHFSIFLRQYNR